MSRSAMAKITVRLAALQCAIADGVTPAQRAQLDELARPVVALAGLVHALRYALNETPDGRVPGPALLQAVATENRRLLRALEKPPEAASCETPHKLPVQPFQRQPIQERGWQPQPGTTHAARVAAAQEAE